MKTFLTEKNNIPEGATHYYHNLGGIGFYRLIDKSWEFWHYFYDCWKPVCDNDCAFEAISIPQTKEVEWVNGEPLECKDEDYEWEHGGRYVCFDGYSKHHVFTARDGMMYHASDEQIRKPETEAERVERERDEFKVEICKDLEIEAVGCNTACIINKLYELGYRKGGVSDG